MTKYKVKIHKQLHSLCGWGIFFIFFATASLPANDLENLSKQQIGINDVVFGIKINELVKKIKKYKEKLDQKKMLKAMTDLKREIEAYTGKRINIEYELNRVESELKNELSKRGVKLKKDELSDVKKLIKKTVSRSHHKEIYMVNCLKNNLDYDDELEFLTYMAKPENEEDNEETIVPLQLVIGVTMILSGFFLMAVPPYVCPLCQPCGKELCLGGIYFAAEAITNLYVDDEKKD